MSGNEKQTSGREANKGPVMKIVCPCCQQHLDVSDLELFSRFPCPTCKTEITVPKWFDDFLLEEIQGQGGMATVYRALDLALDREVAIKVLSEDVVPGSPLAEMFLNEARMAASINHYAVIPIYTCGVHENQIFIVMQFMPGGSLEDRAKQDGDFPVEQVVRWIRDIADGLGHAQKHGIIHHDVKPENIMLDADNNAKIGDFGLAQCCQNQQIEEASNWVSPYCVSPERISEGKESFPGDIYSLGVSFYFLLTKKYPFDSRNPEELLWMRTKKNPLPPNQVRSDVPQEISALVMRMMNRDPETRPAYPEIIHVLEHYLRHCTGGTSLRINRTASRMTGRPIDLEKKNGVSSPGKPADVPRKGPGNYLLWIIVFAACFVLFVIGFALYRKMF